MHDYELAVSRAVAQLLGRWAARTREMDQIQKYIVLLLPIWLLLVFAVFAMHWRRHKRYGVVFPQLPPDRIRFHETGASGFSHKTLFTRFAGAARCLQVTVTDDEVWVRTRFPFNVLAAQTDLEHRIPRALVVDIRPGESRRTLLLDYRDQQGKTHRLSLMLQRANDFLRAVGFQKPMI